MICFIEERSTVVDPKLGTKRICEDCGAKFYDLNKNPATCPKCGHSFDPLAAFTEKQPVKEIAPAAETPEEDEDELEEDEDAISLDEMVEEDDDAEDETALPDFEDAPLDDDDADDDDTLLDTDDDEDDSFLPEETEDDD
jgi:uncharacterized protein (TIGR02300 family)